MVKVEQISGDSPHLATVKALWRQHSATLGFFPDEAFNEYARSRRVVVALLNDQCVGYLLYRISRSKAVVAHLCVDPGTRKKGVAHALVAALRKIAKDQRGIFLKCRQDFDANAMWPRLGFTYIGESAGRAASGSTLIHWWLDFGQPDLFDKQADTSSLDAAIDANIFLDLMEERNDESMGLKADWLQESITLCYTAELLNDVGRSDDGQLRLKRRAEADQFKQLRCTPEEYQLAETVLKPLFPRLPTVRDESDFRHLVRASASGANVFVTRDQLLLDQAQAVFDACGLAIVRPAELIGQVDTLLQEKEYQRRYVAGTRLVSQARISQIPNGLIGAISHGEESQRELTAKLNIFLADPKRYECHTFANGAGDTLALYVIERGEGQISIPLLRVRRDRQAGTVVRYLFTGIIRRAVEAGAESVFIPVSEITESVGSACADLGFLTVDGGRTKIVLSGLLKSTEVLEKLNHHGSRVEELREALGQVAENAVAASAVEHTIWPAKLVDANLPCYIVPIRPCFAEHLFDEGLASGGLFGADVDLALNPESAYYRAAKPSVLTCPSRVLWYVSSSQTYTGSMAVRACSRIVELAKDTPKRLFQKFRRLGVYEWQDVLGTASGDMNTEIMAFRFDDTELLRPLPWDKLQEILKSHGVSTQLQSPAKISADAFCEIYSATFDPPEVR
jgi:GNAT superfamily N-acetyltransferase/predicted nucleic acid-binding protein